MQEKLNKTYYYYIINHDIYKFFRVKEGFGNGIIVQIVYKYPNNDVKYDGTHVVPGIVLKNAIKINRKIWYNLIRYAKN